MSLPRVLGGLEAATVVVGSMIGSGIFLKASGMAALLPHPPLILACWLLAGLLTLSGALVIAELSVHFPGSGGVYLFLREAYGPRVAFLFGWSLLAILQSGSIAGLACGLAQTLAEGRSWTPGTQQMLAFLVIACLTGLHCVSVSLGARTLQNGLTMIKYLGVVGLVLLGLTSEQAEWGNLSGVGPVPEWTLLLPALGAIVLKSLWAYDGWANATFIAGEVRNAERNLPRALVGGTLLVVVAYLAINGAYHLVLSPSELAAAKSPAVAMAQACSGSTLATATGLLLALSMLGTLNSSILSAPRVYYSMAQMGEFPAWMGAISRFQTPYRALIAQGVWAAALVMSWKSFDKITDNVVFVYWIFYALGALAVLKFPPPAVGYRAPWRKALVAFFVTGAGFLVVSQLLQQPAASLQALALLVVGNVFYSGSSPSRASRSK